MAYSYHRRRKSMAATSQDAKSAQILGNTSPFLHPPSRQMLGFPLPDGDGFPLPDVGMLCFSRQWQFWCRGHAHCITTPFTLSHSYPWLLLCKFLLVCLFVFHVSFCSGFLMHPSLSLRGSPPSICLSRWCCSCPSALKARGPYTSTEPKGRC